MKRFLLALQFLTVIPVGAGVTADEADLAKSSAFFVPVGVVQGILLVAADYAFGRVFNPDLVIALVLLVLVLSNGGFHLDGLSDTFDALASKSTGNAAADREKRLKIMKGSTAGPVGVTAIIFTLGLKYLALVEISNFSWFTYYSSLLFMPVLSKWTMVVTMYRGESARQDGLGRFFISGTGFRELAVSTVMLVLVLALPGIALSSYAPEALYLFYAGVLALLYLSCGIWVGYFKGKLGGLTGDTLGAVSEATEISFLLMVIIWSRLSI
jgi:adenosylcobinamide-GDP ribazoletransferase